MKATGVNKWGDGDEHVSAPSFFAPFSVSYFHLITFAWKTDWKIYRLHLLTSSEGGSLSDHVKYNSKIRYNHKSNP